LVKNVTKLAKMVAGLQTKFDKLGVNAEPLKEKGVPWTCKHCKAEKCFASKTKCYKCGESRKAVVPTPPGLGARAAADKGPGKLAPATQPMEEDSFAEGTLEDRIAEAEENLKLLKGKESAWAKSQKAELEALLKGMKEQQKRDRPLPARLQAATDRVATTGQAVKDSETEVGVIEAALQAARQKLEEHSDKHRAALQELEAVKQVAGAEPVGEAEKGLAAGMLAALTSRNIVGTEAEAFLTEVLKFYNQVKSGAGASSGQGQAAAGGLQPETAPAPAPLPLPLRVPPVLTEGGRGRSAEKPKEDTPPRKKSSSRSPRGTRKDGK
jgi:hypothetical protein